MRITHSSRLVLALVAPSTVMAVEPCEVARLSGSPGECFGAGVGISGDYIVVGDPCDGTMGQEAGAAYLVRRKPGLLDWEQQQKIFGTGINFQDTFGQSVAIDGDRVVVGAPHFDLEGSGFGFAYVFQRVGNTWNQQQKLISSGSENDDLFGASVSISGDRIAVGAPTQADYFGRVVVFHWNGSSFVEEATLVGSDTVQWDGFGSEVAIRQDRLLVGVGSANQDQGKAYVFRYDGNGWIEQAILTASDGSQGDRFGDAVSLDGDSLVVGALADDDAAPSSGAAYAYRFSDGVWGNEQKLVAPDPRPFEVAYFGASVTMNGGLLLIGASSDDDRGPDAGSVYVFERVDGLWLPRKEFYADNSSSGLSFGQRIAFDGYFAVVGASFTAYVYTVPICIPAISAFASCILAGLLAIAGVALLRRGKLNFTHYDDS